MPFGEAFGALLFWKWNLLTAEVSTRSQWQVMMPEKRGQPVTIAPEAGITANGVGYGVVPNGVAPPKGERMSIDEVTRALVKDMEQNEAPKLEGDPRPITVAGIEGRSVTLAFRFALLLR
jgi:hypothetical protein